MTVPASPAAATPSSTETKASWKDIRRGADVPPSDDKDEAASGAAIETYGKGNTPIDQAVPASSANTKTGSPSPQAKNSFLVGFSKKQQAAITKALDAVAELEKAGVDVADVVKAAEEESPESEENEDEDDDRGAGDEKLYRSVQTLRKQVAALTQQFSEYVKASAAPPAADLQKVGFVASSTPAGKPSMAALEKQPAYDARQSALQKQVATFEETGEVPDFAALSAMRLRGVLE